MTTDDELLEGGPEDVCATCGHAEGKHIMRDHELAGRTVRIVFCEGCNAECHFVPSHD